MIENNIEITLTESAIARVKELLQKDINKGKFLRIAVSSGGCSGFQYLFNLDDKNNSDDINILSEGDLIIAKTDEVALPFLNGSSIDFVRDLGASYFKVVNPNAKASCGCGSSFAI